MHSPISTPCLSSELAIAGVDEVGRGCLAGPVFAAAVILESAKGIMGLNDSKKLSRRQRERLASEVCARSTGWAVGRAEVEEIDRLNILQATFLAMRRAVAALQFRAEVCWVDGNQDPGLGLPTRLIVGGDALAPCIMAASIIAKVARDQEMERLAIQYPEYGFEQHKGYGTPAHLEALRCLGVSPLHRMSFAPCAEAAKRSATTNEARQALA